MSNSYGTAGRTARLMAQQRYKKVIIYASVLFLIAILLFSNMNNMVKLGLPVTLLITFLVKLAVDRIEKRGLFLKKRAKDADRGAYAEEVVAKGLKNLPEGYHAFHDIAFTGFNIDHVVIGPGGVFLIETKSHKGKVEVKGNTLLLNGAPPSKNFQNQIWHQTYQFKDFLKKHSTKEWDIQPILCFTRAFVSVRKPVKGITVVSNRYLAPYLSKQPSSLNSEDIETLVTILKSSFGS